MRRTDESGMVTFELAVGILAAAILASIMVWAVALVGVSVRCQDVAAQVVRQLSRGDRERADAAKSRAPKGADVEVVIEQDRVWVRVTTDESLGAIGPVRLSGEAEGMLEPGVQP